MLHQYLDTRQGNPVIGSKNTIKITAHHLKYPLHHNLGILIIRKDPDLQLAIIRHSCLFQCPQISCFTLPDGRRIAQIPHQKNIPAATLQQLPSGQISPFFIIRLDQHLCILWTTVNVNNGDRLYTADILNLVLPGNIYDPIHILLDQIVDIHILQLIIFVGVADQQGVVMFQEKNIQFVDDFCKKFIGNIRHDHSDTMAAVGTQADCIPVGCEPAFLNCTQYLFFCFLGITSVPIQYPGNSGCRYSCQLCHIYDGKLLVWCFLHIFYCLTLSFLVL